MKKNNLSIGEKIKNLRQENNLTQEELSKVLMITRQSISSWERNQSIPDIQMLHLISKYFGVSNDYLVEDGYSRVKDKLLRYNVWLIILFSIVISGIGIIYFNSINEVYDDKFEHFKGVCDEQDSYGFISKGSIGNDIVIEELLEVELGGREYCLPASFHFNDTNFFDDNSLEVVEIDAPLGVRINEIIATLSKRENDQWLFVYRVRVIILDDDGKPHEGVVKSDRMIILKSR